MLQTVTADKDIANIGQISLHITEAGCDKAAL